MYAEVFPSRLKEARKKAGYTQVEAAKELDKDQSQISYYENGKMEPNIETIARMAILYNVTTDWLCGVTTKGGPNIKKEITEERNRKKILKEIEQEAKMERKMA